MIKSLVLGRTKTSSIKDANFLDVLSHKRGQNIADGHSRTNKVQRAIQD